jgi:hypothetical protein
MELEDAKEDFNSDGHAVRYNDSRGLCPKPTNCGEDTITLWNFNNNPQQRNIKIRYSAGSKNDANEKMIWNNDQSGIITKYSDEYIIDFEYYEQGRVAGKGSAEVEQVNPLKWRHTLYFRERGRNSGIKSGDVFIVGIQETFQRRKK